MRVRGICCLTHLGMMPLISSEQLWNENADPSPRQHNSPRRKGGNERVTGRKARGPQLAGGNKP